MKIKFLSALIAVLLICYGINGQTQNGAWLVRGNSGTDPSKNFIGTRDAQPLIFKVNNQKAGFLDFSDLSHNTAFGYQTLINNVVSNVEGATGANNSAFGYFALLSNVSGEINTAHGAGALFANTIGNANTSTGAFSLFSNTTGGYNTATGDYALLSNTTGSANIANSTSLYSNTEGSDNIASGVLALGLNTTGNANIACGSFSLGSNVTGSNNTALGFGTDVTADNLTNATAIGNGALVDASNKVHIGNADVTSIGGEVGWTSFSDERIKDNVNENVPGLVFIKALRPVTYHFNVAKENALLGVKHNSAKDISLPQLKGIKMPGGKDLTMPSLTLPGIKNIAANENHEIEKIQFTGFLAQDVDKAAKSIGYDFSGIDKSGKIMGLRYSDFVVPLVKAVQELSKQNENLQKQIDQLKATITSNNNSLKTVVPYNDASLEQNIPNPFSKTTSISYNLPQKFTNAQIIITDKNGKALKQVNITGSSKGTVNIHAATLSAGAYHYSLIVDGRIITSKQMMLTK
jgi:hypothetical protein